MNHEQVMRQALEAMLNFPDDISDEMFESITSLKAALAEPQIDPVDEYRKGFIAGQIDMRDRALPDPEQVAFDVLLREADEIVRGKHNWKRFIDGTPLSNDIPVWMTVFAQDVGRRSTQRKPLTEEEIRSMCKQPWVFEAVMQWVRAVEQAHGIGK